MGYRPGLDGLRGIAILLVILAHGGPPSFDGAGWVGVTVFFVISGFLITGLIVGEHSRLGRVDLRRFYGRRGGRLVPGLVTVVVVVSIADFLTGGTGTVRNAVLALAYSSNWAAVTTDIGALGHTWSLSVEEQFYLIWPIVLVVVGLRSRRPGRALALAVAVGFASLLWRDALLASGATRARLNFGSDTEADGLMAGCALALLLSMGRTFRPPAPFVALALAGLVIAPMTWMVGLPVFVVLGLPLVVGASLILVAAASADQLRVLSTGALVGIGRISYSLYLWHAPIFFAGGLLLPDLALPVRATLLTGLSFAVAIASYRAVEVPIRQRVRRYLDPTTPRTAASGVGWPRPTAVVETPNIEAPLVSVRAN